MLESILYQNSILYQMLESININGCVEDVFKGLLLTLKGIM